MITRIRARSGRVATAMFLVLCISACAKSVPAPDQKDNAVRSASKAMLDTAHTIDLVQKTVIDANTAGLISADDTAKFMRAVIRINEAGKRADAILRDLDKLSNTNADAVMVVFDLVDREFAELGGLITNERTRATIQASIGLARASLNTARILIAAGRSQ